MDNDPILTDHHAIDAGVVDVPEALRVALFKVPEHLLDQETAVGTALAVRQQGPVPVVARLQQLPYPRLGDEAVQAVQFCGDLRGEVRLVGDEACLQAQPSLSAYQVAAQVHEDVVEVEHAHVAGEPLHAYRRLALGEHQVEQVVGVIEAALTRGRELDTELVGDVAQRTFEVRRELARVASRRPTTHPVPFDQEHLLRGLPQGEERRRHARDTGSHDDDARFGVLGQWRGRTVWGELGDPRRSACLVRVRHGPGRRAIHLPSEPFPVGCDEVLVTRAPRPSPGASTPAPQAS